jgi:anti-anti-sigma regulatory factor
MNIAASVEQGKVPVTVIRLEGRLDGGTYKDLIEKAIELYNAGARDILLDLSDLTYISSAGLVALHIIALLLRGETLPDPEHKWSALKSASRSRQVGIQKHLKLLNPRPDVDHVLDLVGFAPSCKSLIKTALRAF